MEICKTSKILKNFIAYTIVFSTHKLIHKNWIKNSVEKMSHVNENELNIFSDKFMPKGIVKWMLWDDKTTESRFFDTFIHVTISIYAWVCYI